MKVTFAAQAEGESLTESAYFDDSASPAWVDTARLGLLCFGAAQNIWKI